MSPAGAAATEVLAPPQAAWLWKTSPPTVTAVPDPVAQVAQLKLELPPAPKPMGVYRPCVV